MKKIIKKKVEKKGRKIPKKIATDTFQFKIELRNEIKAIAMNSRAYYQHFLNTKTKVGDIGTITVKMKKPTRSEVQLNYYAVIVGLIADHTGDTWDDMHSALMILRWGTKKVTIGNEVVEVRKSVSNAARIKKDEMSEQIEFALEKAKFLNIVVPTKESLGYISN